MNFDPIKIEKYILRENYRPRLIIYRKILCEENNIAENSEELQDLLTLRLVSKYNNTYKVDNSLYENHFSKNWIENKLLSETVIKILRQLVSNTEELTSSAEELLAILREIVFNCSDNNLNSSDRGLVRDSVLKLVNSKIIDNWESGNAEAHQHLKQKANAISNNRDLLKAYKQILNSRTGIRINSVNSVHRKLLDLHLVLENHENSTLISSSIIYEQAFDSDWIDSKLSDLSNESSILNKIQNLFRNLRIKKKILFLFILTLVIVIFRPDKYLSKLFNNLTTILNSEPLPAKIIDALDNNQYQENKARALALEEGFSHQKNIKDQNYLETDSIFALSKINNNTYLKSKVDGYKAPIRALDFNSEGNQLAVGGEQNNLIFYQFPEEPKGSYNYISKKASYINSTVNSLDFHPQANFLAVAEEAKIKMFELGTNGKFNLIETKQINNNEIKSIKFSGTGNFLFTLDSEKNLKLWKFDSEDKQLSPFTYLKDSQKLPFEDIKVKSAAFSPNSDILAFAIDNNLFTYNLLSSQQKLKKIENSNITSISFSNDDKYLLIVSNNKVYLLTSELSIIKYKEDEQKYLIDNVRVVKFIPWNTFGNYPFVTIEPKDKIEKEKVNLWEFSAGLTEAINLHKLVQLNKDKEWDIETLAFSPIKDKHIIVTGEKNTSNKPLNYDFLNPNNLLLWDLSNLVEKHEKHIDLGNSSSIRSNSISIGRADRHLLRLILAKNDHTFQVYNLKGIDKNSNFKGRLPDKLIDLTTIINPDHKIPERDRVAVVDTDRNLFLCPLSYEGCENTNIQIPFDNIKLIKNSNNHLVILGQEGESYFVKLSNNFSDRDISQIETVALKDAEISPDGRFIVVLNNDNRIALRNWKTNGEPPMNQTLGQGFDTSSESQIKLFAFSPNGKYLASNEDGRLSLRKLLVQSSSSASYEVDKELSKDLPQQISNFAFSLDSQYLAFTQGKHFNQIKLKNLSNPDTGLISFKPNETLSKIDSIIFSPTLTIKLNSINKQITLNLIVTAESNGKIRLWDFNGREIAVFNSNYNQIIKLLFSPKRKQKYIDEEYPDYLIAIEKDINDNIAIQSWNLTEELNLDNLLTQGCNYFDQKLLSSNDLKELPIDEINQECENINTISTANNNVKQTKINTILN